MRVLLSCMPINNTHQIRHQFERFDVCQRCHSAFDSESDASIQLVDDVSQRNKILKYLLSIPNLFILHNFLAFISLKRVPHFWITLNTTKNKSQKLLKLI